MPTTPHAARRLRLDQDHDDAGAPPRSQPAAFLRPDNDEPDARDTELAPAWTRPPAGWREEADLLAGQQLHAGPRPGAPPDDNPCARRLRLPGKHFAAAPTPPGSTHHAGAWSRGGYLLVRSTTPRTWNVLRRNASNRIGFLTETPQRLEIPRADHWSTLLAVVDNPDGLPLLEPPLVGRSLGLAAIVFDAPWPALPPAVRLADEYRRRRSEAKRSRTRASATGKGA